jgi:hypothetical protein
VEVFGNWGSPSFLLISNSSGLGTAARYRFRDALAAPRRAILLSSDMSAAWSLLYQGLKWRSAAGALAWLTFALPRYRHPLTPNNQSS